MDAVWCPGCGSPNTQPNVGGTALDCLDCLETITIGGITR